MIYDDDDNLNGLEYVLVSRIAVKAGLEWCFEKLNLLKVAAAAAVGASVAVACQNMHEGVTGILLRSLPILC